MPGKPIVLTDDEIVSTILKARDESWARFIQVREAMDSWYANNDQRERVHDAIFAPLKPTPPVVVNHIPELAETVHDRPSADCEALFTDYTWSPGCGLPRCEHEDSEGCMPLPTAVWSE